MNTLEQVLAQHPTLGYTGFGGPWSAPGDWQEDRRMLAQAHQDFQFAVDWLRANCRPAKRVTSSAVSSYALKHYAERSHPRGYLSNGVLIAAALALGYPWRQDGINAWIAVRRTDRR